MILNFSTAPVMNGTWLASTAALNIWSAAVSSSPTIEVLSYYSLFPCLAKHAFVLDAFLSKIDVDCDACALLHLTSTLASCATSITLTPFRMTLIEEYFYYFSDAYYLKTAKAQDVAKLLITKFRDAVTLVSPNSENGRVSAALAMVLSQLNHYDYNWIAATEEQNRIRTHLMKVRLSFKIILDLTFSSSC